MLGRLSANSFRNDKGGKIMRALRKRGTSIISVLALLALASLLASCGGGGGSDGSSTPSGGGASLSSGSSGVSTEVVAGVASESAPLAGQVTVQDSSTPPQQKSTVIASDGSYALDVTGMKAPFILEAKGRANGEDYKLYSFAAGPGTANFNPLANAMVASAAGVKDPEEVYKNPDHETLDRVKSRMPQTIAEFLAKLKRLLVKYAAENDDPVTCGRHSGQWNLFRDVNITLVDGILTITNSKTGAVIFSGPVTDIIHGYFTNDDNDLPSPASTPAAPTGVTATGGAGEVTVSWTAVSNATSYNLYWATASEVTPANGTKVAGVTNPYVKTSLTAGTTYYFIVTAVNSAGESAASIQVSATPNAAPPQTQSAPAAPTGVVATGGTNQVTVSWSAVFGATSYNLYWSTTSGVTTATGTRIAGVTSPAVQTGLSASTTYYYIVTAVNSGGESAASLQVAATTLAPTPSPTAPPAPTGVSAVGGANQVTVSWSAVSGATSYNLYWSTTSGVTTATGTRIAGVTSPYVHTGLADGTTYYYIVTGQNSAGEGPASAQASAATNAAAFDALAYYNPNCAGCHGAPSTFTGGRTAAQLQTAIDTNRGGMGRFSTLTADQVAAIAALLGP
jgi:mono/diheme cytochrome c family protein